LKQLENRLVSRRQEDSQVEVMHVVVKPYQLGMGPSAESAKYVIVINYSMCVGLFFLLLRRFDKF
jgi:hypothetical protein